MKLFALLSLIFLLNGCTGIITGLVIDKNGLPIKGAIVQTAPPTNSVMTSAAGYKIKDVPTGVYSVTATKEGFTEGSASVNVTNKKITTADIQIFKKTQ